MTKAWRGILFPTILFLSPAMIGCDRALEDDASRPESARAFPPAGRSVAQLGANQFSTESRRDAVGEAEAVMDAAAIAPGMTVADIGAGNGYYTVRLAERVGAKGRVLAQDIDQEAIDGLAARVQRERFDNVSIKLGAPDDPRLPEDSFDRVFLVHMYHEVTEPYAFLWRLRSALVGKGADGKPGQAVVVEANRPLGQHGLPPKRLFCEFEAVGYRLVGFQERPELGGYLARFVADGDAPAPEAIKPCKGSGSNR